MRISGVSEQDVIDSNRRYALAAIVTSAIMQEFPENTSDITAIYIKAVAWTDKVDVQLYIDPKLLHPMKLAIMSKLGDILGISRFDRHFNDGTGEFFFIAYGLCKEISVSLVVWNIENTKCKIIRKEQQVTHVSYEADCSAEEDTVDPAPSAN